MQTIVKLGLVLAGVIHSLPVSGVLGRERLQGLYGVAVSDPGLRHRALLFGTLGALLIAAAWVPAMRTTALALGLFSALSFYRARSNHRPNQTADRTDCPCGLGCGCSACRRSRGISV